MSTGSFFGRISRIFHSGSESNGEASQADSVNSAGLADTAQPLVKTGKTNGAAEIEGIGDDETVAVILSAVSQHTHIPLSSLQVKAIRAVD